MKVFTKLALIACLSASISALPTPDGSYGNSMIARSGDIADGTASFGSGPWKKRADEAADEGGPSEWKKRADEAAAEGSPSEWKKRGDDVADGAASFGSGPW